MSGWPPIRTTRRCRRCAARPAGLQAGALPEAARSLPSPNNALEFCQGTIAEMQGEMDVYEAVDRYSRQGAHRLRPLPQRQGQSAELPRGLRRRGRCRHDRCLRIYHRNGYDGVIIPDHTPADDLRRPLARRHGLRAGLHASGDDDDRSGVRQRAKGKGQRQGPRDPAMT